MSTLKADTIVASDGTSPVTLTKQSAAKSFSVVDLTSSNAVEKSLNVSSITDIGTGTAESNFTNSFSDNEYYELHIADAVYGDYMLGCGASTYSTTAKVRSYQVRRDNGSGVDQPKHGAVVYGDLA